MAKQIETGEKHWYAIHTYSGYEDAVKRNLMQRAESMMMTEYIFEVIVPTEKKVKIKNGKRVEEEEKIYPGYVLINMIVSDESWYLVRNTPRVTGFVGSGVEPVPVSEEEVARLLQNMKPKSTDTYEVLYDVGEIVKIGEGPFKEFEGKISEINRQTGKLKVLVSMFGRETPVELDFLQIRKI